MDTTSDKTEMTVEVKARVPKTMKKQVRALARVRMVSSSDILRLALDEYIKRNPKAA